MNTKTSRIKPYQIILHIPHSSMYIPDRCRSLFYLNEQALREELLCMTDSYTDELFDMPNIPEKNRIVFPYSRLICDVERFRDDRQELMAERGMGVCYSMTSELKPLKQISAEHRIEMYRLYDRHHTALTAAADRIMKNSGQAIVIDCHSFASEQLLYESVGTDPGVKRQKRPEICIGTDSDWHTPSWLPDIVSESFLKRGYDVALNDPFSGTLVPMKYYHQDRNLLSIMIEVNRRLYMDESTGEKTAGFETVRKDIGDTITEILTAPDEMR